MGPKGYTLILANGYTKKHGKYALKGITYRNCNSITCSHEIDISDSYKNNTITGFEEVKTALPLIFYRLVTNAKNILSDGQPCIQFNFREVVSSNVENIEMFYTESNSKDLHATSLKNDKCKRIITVSYTHLTLPTKA